MTKTLAKIYLQFFGNLVYYFVSIELSRSNLSLQWKAEQKTKIFKSIFQVRRWTNSRIKSSSERSHMHRPRLSKSALRPAIIKGP